MEAGVHTTLGHTPAFTATLIPTARRWKQTKCPSPEEWMCEMWSVHTAEYSLATQGSESLMYEPWKHDAQGKKEAGHTGPHSVGFHLYEMS